MKAFAGWTHGHSVIPQTPDFTIERLGYWAHLPWNPVDDPAEGWFHFAIPTPTVIQDHQASYKRAMVLFHSTFDCHIDQIDVWDGETQIDSTKKIVTGDYSNRIVEGENTVGWSMSSARHGPSVYWGVGISVHARQGRNPGSLDFISAGVDFVADV